MPILMIVVAFNITLIRVLILLTSSRVVLRGSCSLLVSFSSWAFYTSIPLTIPFATSISWASIGAISSSPPTSWILLSLERPFLEKLLLISWSSAHGFEEFPSTHPWSMWWGIFLSLWSWQDCHISKVKSPISFLQSSAHHSFLHLIWASLSKWRFMSWTLQYVHCPSSGGSQTLFWSFVVSLL